VAEPVTEFDTPAMRTLIADMFDTMHAANGPGWRRRRSASICSW
jgi:peptide deformylase